MQHFSHQEKFLYSKGLSRLTTTRHHGKIIEHEIDSIPIVEKIETSSKEKVKFKIIGKISKTNITKLFVKLGEGN